MKLRLFLLAPFLSCMQSAGAMSLRDGGENMLYFEHARLSAEYCERRGFSVRSAYEAWRQSNAGLYNRSTEGIRMHAEKGGLSKAEQDSVLSEATEDRQRLAQEHVSRKGVACKNFGAVLYMYSSLFKQ